VTVAAAGVRRAVVSVDRRLVVGALLVAVSVLGGLRLSASGGAGTPVWVATRDLAANDVLGPGDLRPVRLGGPAAVVQGLAPASAPVTGRVLLGRLPAGAPVPSALVGTRAAGGREVTVPTTPEHALGGDLRPGERVDVLASFHKGTEAAKTVVVVPGAEVVGLVRQRALLGEAQGATIGVTLAVPAEDATFLVFAVRNGEIDLVRATGRARARTERFEAVDLR
jgi:Flp pilus assembly protein CpaB